MSIFNDLGQEYRDITELFCDTREAISLKNRGAALILYDLAAKKLVACMRAEHAVVYPRFAEVAELVEDVTKVRHTHEAIECLLNLIKLGELDHETWNAEVERLIGLLGESVDVNELSLFPMAGLAMTTEQLVQIGLDFAKYLTRSTRIAEVSITYEPVPPAPEEFDQPTLVRDIWEADDVIALGSEELVELEPRDWSYIFDRRQAM